MPQYVQRHIPLNDVIKHICEKLLSEDTENRKWQEESLKNGILPVDNGTMLQLVSICCMMIASKLLAKETVFNPSTSRYDSFYEFYSSPKAKPHRSHLPASDNYGTVNMSIWSNLCPG